MGDGGCTDAGWTRVDAGAEMGGCALVRGAYVCSHPCKRVHHGGTVFPDGTLFAYGGYGQMCEDYCADVWTFDVARCAGAGAAAGNPNSNACKWTTHGHGDGEVVDPALANSAAAAQRTPVPSSEATDDLPANGSYVGPGKRWRFAHAAPASDDAAAAALPWHWVMFGGHRLWHGFAPANAAANDWNDTAAYPFGGYLDDMWTVTWERNATDGSGSGSGSIGADPGRVVWRQVVPRESCYAHVGATWEARNDLACTVLWPPPRASAALSVHGGGSLFLHGGFSATFPYPQVLGRGAGPGTAALESESHGSYPSQPYYLGDLWRYDVATGLWAQLTPAGGGRPSPRRSHTLTSLGLDGGGMLMLVGGFAGNALLGESWLYNATSRRWTPKASHVHPLLPPNCTSDVVAEGPEAVDVVQQQMEVAATAANASGGTAGGSVGGGGGLFLLDTPSGPVAVSGFRVAGEPTRGVPGLPPLRIPQPRRRAPGWDGCRDRVDGRADLPQALQWLHPGQRAEHAAVYSHTHKLLALFGGEVLPRGQEPASGCTTPPTVVDGQLWGWRADYCPGNCSGRGECSFGYCRCADGWYGVDCSNATCPGDYCRYDPASHRQVCTHCCSAPVYVPPTGDYSEAELAARRDAAAAAAESWAANPWAWVTDTRFPYSDGAGLQKAACSSVRTGRSHGTCNGFGTCQCVPPFTGPDCAVVDCPRNCSGRGACALEFPVGRCLCDPPYTGADCSLTACLNNCSYPHGVCNLTSGACDCGWAANPFNRSQRFRRFDGPDCSYLTAFAGARAGAAPTAAAVLAATAAALTLLLGGGWGGGDLGGSGEG